jgi:hypothetical protein
MIDESSGTRQWKRLRQRGRHHRMRRLRLRMTTAGTSTRDAWRMSEVWPRVGASLPARHANVLHHALGMISDLLNQAGRHDIPAAIDAYRTHEAPLSVPIALIRHHAASGGAGNLADQTN